MRRAVVLVACVGVLYTSQAYAGAGVLIDSIKAHVEQHQTRLRPSDQRQLPPAPVNPAEQWIRAILQAIR